MKSSLFAILMAALFWPAHRLGLKAPAPVAEAPAVSTPAPAAPLPTLMIPAESIGAVAYEMEGEAESPDVNGKVAVRARLMVAPIVADISDGASYRSVYTFPAWIQMTLGDRTIHGHNAQGAFLSRGGLRFPRFDAESDGTPVFVTLRLEDGTVSADTLEDDLSVLDTLALQTLTFRLEQGGTGGTRRITWLGTFHSLRRV